MKTSQEKKALSLVLQRTPWLALILLLGLGLRIVYLSQVAQAPDFSALRQDLDVQDYMARALISGDWSLRPDVSDPRIPDTPYYRPPGYPFFLAAQYFLFGGSYWTPRIGQLVLGLMSILLMYHLGSKLFSRAVGLLTAFFMATYWGFLYFEAEVNDPAIFVFLLPCLFLLLRQWRLRRRWPHAAAIGLLTGAYALMRPNILIFGPVMAAWMAYTLLRRKELTRMPSNWAALALATALIIAPVSLRNWVVSGDFVPISTYFGENLLIGNGPESDGYTSWLPYLQELEGTGRFSVWEYDHIVQGLGKEIGKPDLSHAEASSIFMHKAIDYIRAHPRRTLNLAAKKALLFWSPTEITGNKVLQCEKDHYAPLKYLPGYPMVSALFFFGLILLCYDALRKGLKEPDMVFLLLSFVALYYASFLPFFVNSRARHPLAGIFFLIGAYGLCRLWEAGRSGKYLWCGLGLATLAGLFFVASTPFVPYTPDKARWHYGRADSYLRSGQLDLARQESEALLDLETPPSLYMPFRLGHAFAREEDHAMAAKLLKAALGLKEAEEHPRYREDLYYYIGLSLAALDRSDEAQDYYEKALRLDAADARVLNNLGVLYDQRGDLQQAEAHLSRAVAAAPDFALAHSNLADLLLRQGRQEEAIRHFQQAVAEEPMHPGFHYNLARALDIAGKEKAARSAYEQALELNPKDPRILNNLALLAAKAQDIALAQQYFQQAIDLEQDFSLAWINWATMLQERGDTQAAQTIYEQALEKSPEDAALHNGLGYLYATTGKTDLAEASYQKALDLSPRYALALNNYGNLLLQAHRVEEAIRSYQRAAEADTTDYRAWLNLGRLHTQQGESDQAQRAYQEAIKRAPKLIEAHFALANLSTQTGDLDAALRGYAHVLGLAPDHAQAHCNYGMVLAASGALPEARRHLERALELTPSLSQAQAMLDRLDALEDTAPIQP